MFTPIEPATTRLIEDLGAAMSFESCEQRCEAVKAALVSSSGDPDVLADAFLEPSDGCYARRLLHRDPGGRFSVVVMVWDEAQGTPIHDHDGRWCVECVFAGRIRITSYRVEEELGSTHVRLAFEEEVTSTLGDAGALIPPFEHHKIENAGEGRAVTVHVYSGEIRKANVFLPDGEGRWRRETKELSYSA